MNNEQSLANGLPRWPHWRWVWIALVVLGLAGWLAAMLWLDTARAWRALLINFLYFTPLALGMAAWPGVVMASQGRWAGVARRAALAASFFAPVSLLAFAALWLGKGYWAAWIWRRSEEQIGWLGNNSVFVRDGIALLVVWAMAILFAVRANRGRPVRLGAWMVFLYCIVMSLVAFDMLMALDPEWYSTLFGGYFFISGMYIAVAAWTFAALALKTGADSPRLHDLGKLIVTFSLLTTYMMFSQLLVIWYENLPHEVRFVIPRLRLDPWKNVSVFLLALIYLGPLVLLLGRRAKKSKVYLWAMALAVLVGMWVERWWLVTPTLGGPMVIGLAEVSATALFLGLLATAIGAYHRWMPPTVIEEIYSE